MSSILPSAILANLPADGSPVAVPALSQQLTRTGVLYAGDELNDAVKQLLQLSLLEQDSQGRLRLEARLCRADVAFAEMLATLATNLIHCPPSASDQRINQALAQVARFVEADRSYIFHYDTERQMAYYTHEWCAAGISPQIDSFAKVPLTGMDVWLAHHERGEAMVIDDVEKCSEAALVDVLKPQGIQSTAAVPMMEGGVPLGFVGFDAVRAPRRFRAGELRLLQLLAQMLVNVELRKQQQQALDRAQAELETLSTIIRHSPVVAMSWQNSRDWPLRFVSDNISRFGYQPEELLSGHVEYSALIHPEDLPRIRREVATHVQQGPDTYRQEYRLRHGEGHWIWVEDFTWLTRDEKGVVQHIHGVLSDVTPRVLAEQALQESEQRFRGLLEGVSNVAVQGYDAEKKVIFWNRASELLYGYTREEALGRSLLELIIPPEARQHVSDGIDRAMSSGQVMPAEELTLQDKRSRSVPVYSSHALQRNAKGELELYCIDIDMRELHRSRQQLVYMARYDELTGLANRAWLSERLRQLLAEHQEGDPALALIYIDLDGFKAINDQYGHSFGDRYLIAVAERLQGLLGPSDLAARPGGDEFILLLGDMRCRDVSDPEFRRLTAELNQPLAIDGHTLQVSASMGVSFYPQAENIDADQLIRQADQAMYSAKAAGNGSISFFDPALEQRAQQRQRAAQALRQAVEKEELRLHYQPKVDLRQGRVLGVEALLRWQHPEEGLRQPEHFMSLMEADGVLNREMTQWILSQALGDLSQLQQAGHELSVSVNVNLSLQQNGSDDFVSELSAQLSRHPELSPRQLIIEILESTVIEDMDRISRIIREARALGVGFSLDDFGTGYSSLTYLKHLPLDEIKIDRSFVGDMLSDTEDMRIVRGIVGLADAFHIPVVAEGVETDAHARCLMSIGCHLAQGYAIARPMPLPELLQWLQHWQPNPVWVDTTGAPCA